MSISITAAANDGSLASVQKALTQLSAGHTVSIDPGSGSPAMDTISLSAKARAMLAVSTEIAAFEAEFQANRSSIQTDNSTAFETYRPTSATVTASGATTYSSYDMTFEGTNYQTDYINGSENGDDTINVSALENPSDSNTVLTTYIKTGNGNDTINATTNAAMSVTAGNGNDTINVTTTGPKGFASVGVGSAMTPSP